MPLTIKLDKGESLRYAKRVTLPGAGEPFGFALSTTSLYLPARRWFAVSDPTYFIKVPVSAIQRVRIRTVLPIRRWLVFGLFLAYSAYLNIAEALDGPPVLRGGNVVSLVAMVLILWNTRPRAGAVVYLLTGRLRIDGPAHSNRRDSALLGRLWRRFVPVCQRAGIPVEQPGVESSVA